MIICIIGAGFLLLFFFNFFLFAIAIRQESINLSTPERLIQSWLLYELLM